MPNNTSDYDEEPVVYCARCYSLKIKYDEAIDAEYCANCGSSDILSTSIEEWEKLYEGRYGKKFTERGSDPKNSPLFKMPIKKLKLLVYDSEYLNEILHIMYPKFPKGLSKAESVILLFDKISKDNKLDDLRLLLMNYVKY